MFCRGLKNTIQWPIEWRDLSVDMSLQVTVAVSQDSQLWADKRATKPLTWYATALIQWAFPSWSAFVLNVVRPFLHRKRNFDETRHFKIQIIAIFSMQRLSHLVSYNWIFSNGFEEKIENERFTVVVCCRCLVMKTMISWSFHSVPFSECGKRNVLKRLPHAHLRHN